MKAGRVAAYAGFAALMFGAGIAGAWWVGERGTDAAEPVAETPGPPQPLAVSLEPRFDPAATVPQLAWGPDVVAWGAALTQARAMSVDDAAGAVIVATVTSPDPAAAASLVADHGLAGVIVMGDAAVSASQVRSLTSAVADATGDRGWPAVISTDQEGGPVARLQGIVEDLPALMAAGASRDKQAVTDAYTLAGREMATLGFTVDWAPVADVTVGLDDPVIRVRSAGSDADNVAATAVAAMHGYLAGGVVPAVKHFPGHGSVTTDSHLALPTQSATPQSLAERDFVPFARAIDEGAPMVMMGHIALEQWGSGPSTTAPAAYAYLREEMGFTGVVVTDAMNMRAIADRYAPGASEVAALAAGADIVLMPRSIPAAKSAIVAAVAAGDLPRERLDEAVARVILMMRWQDDLALAAEAVETTDGYARAFAASSAVVGAQACGGPFVGSTVTISGGWPAERQALAAALAEHGVGLGGGTSIRLLGSSSGTGTADVVVAMDGPWGLPGSRADVYVGLFGRSDDALAGLADVLVGAVPPGGSWPVALEVPDGC